MEQERTLVRVGRQVDTGWTEPDQETGKRRAHDGRQDGLAGERPS
jgi:hypothetical protein